MRLWKLLLGTRPPGRLTVVALLTLLAACSALGQMRYVPGRVLVKFRDGVARLPLSPEALAGAMPVGHLGRGEALVLAVPRGANEVATARALRMRPDVEAAEPDYLFEPQATPNDPQFPNQWHLAKIQAPQAWDLSKGSQQVVIAIIDSGVDPNHPDLAPKLVPGWNVLNGTSSWADDNGHGTAVAGAAAAATNNAVGVAGVAWNCRIMPVKAAGTDGYASSSSLYDGLVWAADNGARVANLSFKVTDNFFVTMGMQHFVSKGGVVTVAAGNDSAQATTPDNPNCLTVVATDSADQKTSWSAYGSNVDLSAPGSSILTTSRGGGYGSWAGTSFAAPIVAGAAGILLSVNPSLTPNEVMQILKDTADDLGAAGRDNTYGTGRLNLRKAVVGALQTLDDQEEPTVSINAPTSLSGTVQVTVNASDNVYVDSVDLYVDGNLIGRSTTSPATFTWDTTTVPNGNHLLVAKARDLKSNEGYAELPVSVRNGDAQAPQVSFINPTNGANLWGRLRVRINAQDNTAVRTVRFFVDNTLIRTFTAAPYEMDWSSASVPDGSHTLRAVAEDTSGNQATAQVSVQVVNYVDNVPPTVSFRFPRTGQRINGGVVLSVDAQDDRAVRYVRLYLNGTLLRTFTSGPYEMNWSTRSVPDGSYTLRAEAVDGLGNTASDTVTVTVDNSSVAYEDNEAPVVSFVNPTNGQTVSGTLAIRIEGRDNVGVESIQFFADGVLIRTFTFGPYTMQWSSKSVWDGPRVLTAVAKDKKGNTSVAQTTINGKND
ncbi:MAG: Ig-like domain-containing protein [Fimbriimonadaceae bacterium]